MTNIAPALTKVAAGSTGVTSGATALKGSSTSGVLAGGLPGADFWSMILSQFGATETKGITDPTAMTATTASTDAVTSGKGKPSDNPLVMLQVALASQPVDAQGNLVVAEDAATEKLQGQLDLTNKIISHVKNMMPDNADQDGMLKNILAKLQSRSDTLQASLSTLEGGVITKDTPVEDIPLPMLIAIGLNPSEISEVTEHIQALEKKLGRDITVEDLIAGVGGLIAPAQQQANAVASLNLSTNKGASDITDSLDETSQPTDDLAAKLNALEPGAKKAGLEAEAPGQKQLGKDKTDAGLPKPDALIKADHNNANTKQTPANFKENLVNTLHNANNNSAQTGDMTFPVAQFGSDADAAMYQSFGFQPSSSLTFGSAAQAASFTASPASAGQAHPATQMVAATLVKQGKDGADNTMTIRLDPPELGSVNVRLQIGKDKSVKAHITVEKSETYMMLQRDGHALERALQSAGLETNTDSISFELAQDNSAFGHDNNGQGTNENNFGKGGLSGTQNAGASNDIIQSSVTWQVDPSTGHVRYNLFA